MGLNYEKEGHIAKVGLNRPKERNALDPQILMDLHEAWKDINADDAIRVVILHSCLPDIFCSGMDLRTAIPILTKMREPETDAERWLARVGPHVAEAMLKPNIVKKPVIAAVNGYCLTGGFEMIMGADLRLASEDAVFQMREASLGIMPTGGSNVYLPRILTPCRAMEILLTARKFQSADPLRVGIPQQGRPRRRTDAGGDGDGGEDRGQWAARHPGDHPLFPGKPGDGLHGGLPEGTGDRASRLRQPDAREGIRAQKEKRKPNFPGTYA